MRCMRERILSADGELQDRKNTGHGGQGYGWPEEISMWRGDCATGTSRTIGGQRRKGGWEKAASRRYPRQLVFFMTYPSPLPIVFSSFMRHSGGEQDNKEGVHWMLRQGTWSL